jgi:hypothetical protein
MAQPGDVFLFNLKRSDWQVPCRLTWVLWGLMIIHPSLEGVPFNPQFPPFGLQFALPLPPSPPKIASPALLPKPDHFTNRVQFSLGQPGVIGTSGPRRLWLQASIYMLIGPWVSECLPTPTPYLQDLFALFG